MSAKGKQRRVLTAEAKLKVLERARQPNMTVAEMLRRHQVDATTSDRWEREAKAAMREALACRRGGRTSDEKDREIARLQQEVEKKSRVIAEVVEENLALERGL